MKLPDPLLQVGRLARTRLKKWRHAGGRYACSVCGARVAYFLPLPPIYAETMQKHGAIHPIDRYETLNLQAYACPICEASDRERLYALFWREHHGAHPANSGSPLRVIDFSPSAAFSTFMRKLPNVDYRSAGYRATSPHIDDHLADLTNLENYPDDSFDAFVCSHVLEHVSDAESGARELYRITKATGIGIVMVPIALDLNENLEDPRWTSEAERWKHYGQGDHVRLFSKSGFRSLLERAGFHLEELGEKHFRAATFQRHAISSRSVLYVVTK